MPAVFFILACMPITILIKTIDDVSFILRECRKLKGMTQLELSLCSGISQDMISSVESGRRNPSLQTFLSVCSALDIKVVLDRIV